MKPLALALVYDRKEDYLAAGFSPADVMELDSEETIAAIAGSLAGLGHEVERVGGGVDLARQLVAGRRWDLVFNIAEGVRGRSREAQVPAVCELFDQAYVFSDPLTCAVTLDKAVAKRLVRDCGLPTAPFAVVAEPDDADRVDLPAPLFVKPAAEGSSKGIERRSKVERREDLRGVCAELLAAHGQPVLVEAYLPGREVTVGIVGNAPGKALDSSAVAEVVGVMEIAIVEGEDREAYTAENKADWERRMSYRLLDGEPLAAASRKLALAAFAALGCRDAARVDLRCDGAGQPCFLEVNPLPGLNPKSGDLPLMAGLAGIGHRDLLGRIVEASRRRWGL
jgi:D-alanine-D-alanine ligase